MGNFKLGLAALAALSLLLAFPHGSAKALPMQFSPATEASVVIRAGQDGGPAFHHGRRTQEVFCLRQNYWWFYRPYTTAVEDFPRCEPYFHYLEPAYGPRRGRNDNYIK